MMTESAFSIEELEELYCLFKVSSCLLHGSCADLMFRCEINQKHFFTNSVRKCFSKQDETSSCRLIQSCSAFYTLVFLLLGALSLLCETASLLGGSSSLGCML